MLTNVFKRQTQSVQERQILVKELGQDLGHFWALSPRLVQLHLELFDSGRVDRMVVRTELDHRLVHKETRQNKKFEARILGTVVLPWRRKRRGNATHRKRKSVRNR